MATPVLANRDRAISRRGPNLYNNPCHLFYYYNLMLLSINNPHTLQITLSGIDC